MGGVAGIVEWEGAPVDAERVRRMLDAAPYRGPDGWGTACRGRVGLGMARLALRAGDRQGPLPLCRADGGPILAADARIYNRVELLRLLRESGELPEELSDAGLILAGYERWGESVVERLDGDFAFVVWDPMRETLLCARDPFGVKPLFYRAERGAFLVASEPGQVRAGTTEPIGGDEEMLWRHFVGEYRDDGRCFLEGVRRMLPGSMLRVTRQGAEEIRYWRPEALPPLPHRDPADVRAELRFRLRRAVEKRLDAEAPIVAELSGGYDSSAIVVLASGILGDGVDRSRFSTISSTYAGLPCDETPYIREVLEATGLHGQLFDAREGAQDPERLVADLAHRGSPHGDVALNRTESEGRILAEAGGRVLLSGLGGDEVATPPDYVFDMVERGSWAGVVRECRDVSRAWESSSFLGEIGRALRWAAPEALKRAARRARGGTRRRSPAWLEPGFAEKYGTGPSPGPRSRVGKSIAWGEVARWFQAPRLVEGLELTERIRARQGVEVRYPFLDRGLVELVLGVPFALRRAVWPPYPFKAALRTALRDDLPALVRERGGKVVFDDYFMRLTESWRQLLLPVLGPAEGWETRAFVRPELVNRLLREPLSPSGEIWSERGRPVWSLATAELWYRQTSQHRI